MKRIDRKERECKEKDKETMKRKINNKECCEAMGRTKRRVNLMKQKEEEKRNIVRQ